MRATFAALGHEISMSFEPPVQFRLFPSNLQSHHSADRRTSQPPRRRVTVRNFVLYLSSVDRRPNCNCLFDVSSNASKPLAHTVTVNPEPCRQSIRYDGDVTPCRFLQSSRRRSCLCHHHHHMVLHHWHLLWTGSSRSLPYFFPHYIQHHHLRRINRTMASQLQ